jgi:EAL domain-containing protein (putative c-di-GMP-specific phosphodiesterase class I)
VVTLFRRNEESLDGRRTAGARPASASDARPTESARPGATPPPGADIGGLIERREVRAEFQPVVRIDGGEAVGFEAFARCDQRAFAGPRQMYAAARDAGLSAQLDQVVHAAAYRSALEAKLHPSQSVFVNADLTELGLPVPKDLADVHAQAAARLRLFIDVSEGQISRDPAAALAGLAHIRAAGWGVSWDNAGTNPDSMALMPLVRPDVIKIDMSVIQDSTHPIAARLVNTAYAYAERTGAALLAAGIETTEHVAIAQGLGARLGQGYLFGRPGALPGNAARTPSGAITLIPELSPNDPADTPFQVYQQAHEPAGGSLATLSAFARHIESRCAMDPEPPVLLACLPQARLASGSPLAMLEMIARNTSFAAALLPAAPEHAVPRVRLTALAADDPIRREWALAVLGPHFAVLLTAERADEAADDVLRVGLTYHRDTVLRAARCLLARTHPDPAGAAATGRG